MLCRTRACGQRHGKHVRFRLPARAVARLAAYGLQRLRNGNVEVICYPQPVFNLLRTYGMASARSPFDITTFCHRQMGQDFSSYRIFVLYFEND